MSDVVFEGSVPKRQSDFDLLRTNGVRTILSLRVLPWHIPGERKKAIKNGLNFVRAPIPATPLEPSEESVKAALTFLSDPTLQPVYVHCFLGRDRTTLIVALYRVYFENWTPQAAWAEMLNCGFKPYWGLRGFETYFWSHTEKPDWVNQLLAERAKNGQDPPPSLSKEISESPK